MNEGHDRLAALVSRLLAGDLPDEERPAAMRHLAACDECRALADVAELLRHELARDPGLAAGHPEAPLLARFALHPERMPAGASAFVAEHLASCAACADAVRVARASEALDAEVAESARAAPTALPAAQAAAPWSAALWELLKGSLLRPEAAVAYLLLLAVVVPYALRGPAGAPSTEIGGAAVLPSEVVLGPGDVMRGGPPADDAVTDVLMDAGASTLHLALATDLDPLDWEIAGGPLELAVEARGKILLRAALDPSRVDDAGVVRVTLPAGHLARDAVHRVTIRARGSEEPPLFEASFRPVAR